MQIATSLLLITIQSLYKDDFIGDVQAFTNEVTSIKDVPFELFGLFLASTGATFAFVVPPALQRAGEIHALALQGMCAVDLGMKRQDVVV